MITQTRRATLRVTPPPNPVSVRPRRRGLATFPVVAGTALVGVPGAEVGTSMIRPVGTRRRYRGPTVVGTAITSSRSGRW
jgi:hypothetical protein